MRNQKFRAWEHAGVEVSVMKKFLSLAVMCSLALPAMALGQDTMTKPEEQMKELEKAE